MVTTMKDMKDTGVEWIREIPSNWTVNRIKYLFQSGKGLSITKDNLVESGLPVVSYGQIHSKKNSGTDIKDELLRYVDFLYENQYPQCKVNQYDFVFADTSEDFDGIGNCVYKREDELLFAGYHSIILKSKYRTDNRYLAYLFKTDEWRKQIREKAFGVKVYSVPQKSILNASVIMPPMDERNRIADFLDAKCVEIDALSADIQSEIDTLEAYKRSVITEAVTKGLDKNVQLKDSGVKWCQEIPVHWSIIPSKYLFGNSDLRRYADDVLLTASQKYGVISQEEYMINENAKIVLANQGIDKWKHVEPNDFIISLRSFQGGLEMSKVYGCVTWHYIVLKAKKQIYHDYYKWLFKSDAYIKALQNTCNYIRDGQDLRFSNFAQVPLFVVPIEEQKQIAQYLDQKVSDIDTVIKTKQEQLLALADYKKSLIYEYVTGKKEVPA